LTTFVLLTASLAGADVVFEAHLSATELHLGEPIELHVSLELAGSSDDTAQVLSERFLVIRVIDQAGNPLPRKRLFDEHYHEEKSNSAWFDRTIRLSPVKPRWEKTIDLDFQFQFLEPGRYGVSVAWEVPELEADEKEAVLQEVIVNSSASPANLLSGYSASWDGELVWLCPESEVDSRAYRFLAGGECPSAPLTSVATRVHREMRTGLLEQFPTSVYAGYWLAEWKSVPYGRYLNAERELVTYLGTGAFTEQHPAVSVILEVPKEEDGRLVGRETVDTVQRIEEHRNRLANFLEVNPSFQLRDDLEMALAFDVLALGDVESAKSHWLWVAENSASRKAVAKARANVGAIEKSGLLDE